MNLISTKPDSDGKENVLERAAQLTDFKWTPLRNVPTHIPNGFDSINTVFAAGEQISGMPYSNNAANDKFLCENVSFETFLSAIANPDSVLYNKNLYGYRNSSTYYGIVCSGFVRYALDIKERYPVKYYGTIPGMKKIADCNSYRACDIRLCDVLYAFCSSRVHVALITDIIRDENGAIVEIEVSEAVRPRCKRERFGVNDFYEKYSFFELWRYDYIDSVRACEPGTNDLLFGDGVRNKLHDISIDFGNKSNYFLGQETIISVFRNTDNKVQVYKNGSLIFEIVISGSGNFSRTFDVGYYEIRLDGSDETVEFYVNYPLIFHTVKDGVITINANPGNKDSVISHMDFYDNRCHNSIIEGGRLCTLSSEVSEAVPYYYNFSSPCETKRLSEKEIESGIIVAPIPKDAGYFKITFKNKHGLWTHQMIKI